MVKPISPTTQDYDRPNQKWVCGRTRRGDPCKTGPDHTGNCRADFQCIPRRQGDRWICTSEPPCQDGPLPDGTCCTPIPPCRPEPSLGEKRKQAGLMVTALCISTLILVLFSPLQERIITPGPLSPAHATAVRDCGDCHTAAQDPNVFQWAATALNLSPPGPQDSAKCLNCHPMGPNAMAAHSCSPSQLVAKTRAVKTAGDPSLASQWLDRLFPMQTGQISCNTCHKEHHGTQRITTRLSDSQCQSCHKQRFKSLANGHPEFSNFPYGRRTPTIRFSHTSHLNTHFQDPKVKSKAPGDCTHCHQTDAQGRGMTFPSFETGCAPCHLGQIRGQGITGELGIRVFSVPGLDLDTLKEHDIAIGAWPALSEEPLTPFMALLLRDNADIEMLQDLDLLDLTHAGPAQLEQVRRLAWAVKKLFHDIRTHGHQALTHCLSRQLRSDILPQDQSAFTAALSFAVMDTAAATWFPDLDREITLLDQDAPLPETRPSDSPYQDAPPPREKTAPPANEDSDDLLASNDQDDLLADEPGEDLLTTPDNDNLLSDDSTIEAGTPEENTDTEKPPADPAQWVLSGGWYQRYSALLYRPAGHGDPFLKYWIEAAPLQIVKALAPKGSPGMCLKCHSPGADGPGYPVRWKSGAITGGIARFTHPPHVPRTGDRGCRDCHALKKAGAAVSGPEPSEDFAPMTRTGCTRCHRPEKAGDGCQICHNYHTTFDILPEKAGSKPTTD